MGIRTPAPHLKCGLWDHACYQGLPAWMQPVDHHEFIFAINEKSSLLGYRVSRRKRAWLGLEHRRLIQFTVRQQSPENASMFGGQRDDRLVVATPVFYGAHPLAFAISPAFQVTQNGPCAMDQQRAQVDVAALGDASQAGLATARVLPRYQTQPSR